ncbi:calcium-binding EGF-like domain-containing protein [Sorangium sp. So ce1097]|uniref:calcium-binding EGF-like domain-containing protein n=1 Tax=Sorangium sp. So ce1097 TaxID=3133330 RepID=UPI003F5F469B
MKRKTPLVLMSLFTLLGAKFVTMLSGCTPTPAEDDHLGSAECMPEDAACDATLPCCDGFQCQSGTCVANVSDHCAPSPCQNGSTCVNDAGGYTCTCLPGYTGTNCEMEIDSDHCAPSPCQNGSTCVNDAGGYTCTCLPGYTGTNCETEIDECASNPCVNGTCLDGVDFYQCECAPGWTGTDCDINIDECAGDPCLHGTCTDGINGYTCACDPGYEGQNCDVDHDDCNPNLCQNGGTCVDGVNSYTCQCETGWMGTNCETPAPPTIGCHDDPATSGNTGVDDLYYLGPIDTINNVSFYRAPRDGTCSGSSYQNGAALIAAASAAEAETKCQSLTGGDAFDASIWNGLAGFWLCL